VRSLAFVVLHRRRDFPPPAGGDIRATFPLPAAEKNEA
jgi:hypothetical protein